MLVLIHIQQQQQQQLPLLRRLLVERVFGVELQLQVRAASGTARSSMASCTGSSTRTRPTEKVLVALDGVAFVATTITVAPYLVLALTIVLVLVLVAC